MVLIYYGPIVIAVDDTIRPDYATATSPGNNKPLAKPNIIFILVDDQDARMDSLSYMPNVQKYLIEQGTTFKNHYATVALCCPSRVSMLRGQYAHNTRITDTKPPYGGYTLYNLRGLGNDYLPLWMKKAGYTNHYIGKLMNDHAIYNYATKPAGFDYGDYLLDPYSYDATTPVFSRDGELPVYYVDTHQTDAIHTKTLSSLKSFRGNNKPFFLTIAPAAPHAHIEYGLQDRIDILRCEPPIPASRHSNLFPDAKIPRRPHFNPADNSRTASYWKKMNRLNDTEVEQLDANHRRRIQALQSVDDMVGSLFQELEAQGKLDNTYVVYSSDNGYHLGQHRAYAGKMMNIEEDINVPLIVRGPGVDRGKTSDVVGAFHDFAPTFLALAHGDEHVPSWVDGGVLPWTEKLKQHDKPAAKESFAVEYWAGEARYEGDKFWHNAPGPNTYKTLRLISEEYNIKYTVWCTGEHELYDMKNDPYELQDIFESEAQENSRFIARLDVLLSVLKECSGPTCRDPWRILHPNDDYVKTLYTALDAKYDAFYQNYPKVSFKLCLPFYSELNEITFLKQEEIVTDILHMGSGDGLLDKVKDTLKADNLFKCPSRKLMEEKNTKCVPSDAFGEAVRLFNLVPRSPRTVGDRVPSEEELNARARPLPQELLESKVNWADFGFYGNWGN
ncbi:alkaline-phosphatase-like protein [Phascolomyces articulosus]|uniref:Alkaline-phosphatase-like protein n=1 Tax=Phascolomyces articulosus TaxID=60185 RepID=A0AAD5PJY2_9FUNG|nr:alkaline-phosphatase-like protein [Phascolomyces articulosus]